MAILKKILLIIIAGSILIPLIFFLWWNLQTPLKSGLYPQKQTGLFVAEVDGHSSMFDFELPILWVKSYPWSEQVPYIEEGVLLNQEGEEIAIFNGSPTIPHHQNKWTDRVINGHMN